ncbi:MAG: hypothetical protein K6F04_02060, partial [bacterium]|nr:hypothetical protein [bacterium]
MKLQKFLTTALMLTSTQVLAETYMCEACPDGQYSTNGETCTNLPTEVHSIDENGDITCKKGYYYNTEFCPTSQCGRSVKSKTETCLSEHHCFSNSKSCTEPDDNYQDIYQSCHNKAHNEVYSPVCTACPTGTTTVSNNGHKQTNCNICAEGYHAENGSCVKNTGCKLYFRGKTLTIPEGKEIETYIEYAYWKSSCYYSSGYEDIDYSEKLIEGSSTNNIEKWAKAMKKSN